jgi:16S rRNA processing protein RimM
VVTVASCRPHQGRALLTIEGVTDRDAAELLRGMEVLVEASKLPEISEDEVYLHDIVGFDAVLEDGSKVGTLEGFLDVPGQDVWIILGPDGREILLPAHDETIVEIDTQARRIVVDPPPGLLDLY